MQEIMNSLVDSSVQCWGCEVFDRLFEVVSMAAAAVYDKFATLCIILFCLMFAFFVYNAVWKNIKGGFKDLWYEKSIRPVFINALIAMTFLGMGVAFPRFVTTVTFEPVAQIATTYTQSMLQMDTDTVNERITYQPREISNDGFFRPQLRDEIILLMKTSVTQFQSYIKLSILVIDSAFDWHTITGIGALLKHVMIFFIGIFLFYNFFKIFFRFCCYFVDIIVAMAFFAFLFPLSLSTIAFQGAADVPKWMESFGKSMGTGQIKNLINAIIALAAAVLTYTVIIVLLSNFFVDPNTEATEIIRAITTGDIYNLNLSDDNLAHTTLAGCVVLVYIINFMLDQVPEVTKMVLSAFNVSEKHDLGDEVANNAGALTQLAVNKVKDLGSTIINKVAPQSGTKK